MQKGEILAVCKHGKYNAESINGTLEETHISWVILTSRFVFKIKKPLNLSFLDFSSLAKRKFYCERELELNSRLTDIYLDVVPVKTINNIWRVGRGAGKIVDYAVRMKRMRSSLRMDSLLRSGKVNNAHIRTLAKSIASFHTTAVTIASPFDRLFLQRSFNDIRTIKGYVGHSLGKTYTATLTKAISWSNFFLRRHSGRFHQRVKLGLRRDLHGDLHSGNIFLYKDPVIFDCIEFNDSYRQIDVIDEAAFFCMDLEAFGKDKFSGLFIKEYSKRLSCFETDEDTAIFQYYKCYRANVRAKVHAIAASQESDAASCREHLDALARYFHLIERYIG